MFAPWEIGIDAVPADASPTLIAPVFVFQGAEDFTTPTSLARSFVNSIRAPRKAFVSIDDGGHFVVFMKSDAFLEELVARVLPLVKRP